MTDIKPGPLNFDNAKKFSDFIGMIVRMAFCLGISATLWNRVPTQFMEAVGKLPVYLSSGTFFLFSIYLGACIGSITADYIYAKAEELKQPFLRNLVVGISWFLAAWLWLSSVIVALALTARS
ncbi:hypothetical protein [Rhizobium sp. C1]|uniref:hypothetical protein n=1 Tax=Rhizobium sp. C1 TaxID=1349799 RepID=UPI001E321BFE|nr:hypothetical protein [Rhizobium sp. C1]MCD2176700.1 hypothetical protein [Rhizobium sp. C1]